MTLFEPEPLRRARSRRLVRSRRAMVTGALSTILAVSVIGGGIYLVQHPQPILDQITVWEYEPTPAIEAHVDRLSLTDHGRFLYYASRPEVNSSSAFEKECPAHEGEDGFGILGCYLPGDKTIFLYDVTDERLDGTEEITAAHEMLHAAWDRIGQDERAELTTLLEAEFDEHSTDPKFAERMAIYARIEPGEHANELHSIIGTELASISPRLEEYYAKYFTDRRIVTGLHAASNAVFIDLKKRSDELVAAMDALRIETEADYARYTSGYDALNEQVVSFNLRAKNGNFGSPQEFNTERAALVRRQAELDSLHESITDRQDEFETMRVELEGLNAVSTDLQRGLNIGGEVTVEEPAE